MRRLAACLLLPALSAGYPLDGAAKTGIRRLTGYQLAAERKIASFVNLPPGAFLRSDNVKLHLKGVADNYDITPDTPKDPELQKGIEAIFAGRDPSYAIAILDISDPARPRYASLREDTRRIPGSVGKLLVATGIFGGLAKAYPNDINSRLRVLTGTKITADAFVHVDSKTVPFYNIGDKLIVNRRLQIGDTFNLYEWLDHMLSQSSNAAAAQTWKHGMLLHQFGARYDGTREQAEAFFRDTSKKDLAALSLECNEAPLRAAGIDTGQLRIGTFFTSGGERVVPGTASYATPRELLRWLVRVEQGKLVDAWSSLEIKRLLYFSRPRYRYSSSPALAKAAVYFKSGSLFECVPEPGYQCVQYKGNQTNLMHSVAIVESGAKVYLVALMSNVLKLNSAVEHQTIATFIERLLQSRP